MRGIAISYLGGGLLKRGETAEFTPSPSMITYVGIKVTSADFIVMIQYRQWAWPYLLEKRIRFKAERKEDDRWAWIRPFMTELDRKLNPETIITMLPPTKENNET
jgi:hypothetical protein